MTAAYNYFHVTNFFWMFGEGCYLHTAIVLTYSTDRLRKWMFICIGWGEQATPCPGQPSSSHPDSGQLAGGPETQARLGWWGVHTALCHYLRVGTAGTLEGAVLGEYWGGGGLPPLGTGLPWGPPGSASPRPHRWVL